ncbi:hypothetical protein K457DRAFT_12497 [Linnemannia elongata AG-77]|uniref:RNI-like protein n=1 Tax=Linnemannia elongata AG-77 TaxID=1314771 RepID=A0A197KGJ5_9FUNG|nr:hypothetical protein K457DRAFT_12497 [Linnemannia elongata AG-77]
MTPYQCFRQGDKVDLLAVRKDKNTGELYSRLTDIQGTFPGAQWFKVNGVTLYFLEDDNEQLYEPKRIAHYPDDTIDIIADPVSQASPPKTLSSTTRYHTSIDNPNHQPQLHSTRDLDLSVSSLSLQQPLPHATSNAPVLAIPQPLFSSSQISNLVTLPTTSIARPMAMLSTMALDITQLQQQLERSTDQQSVYHQQQMQQLINMVQQQNDMVAQQSEMVRQQNLMLQEQAASKEREERILQEQAESKARDEQMLKMQQETIDRLTVNQQRVETLLVQNYELHEYPIPRLFVVLPDSKDWDPRNFLMERFRLFFLCECGDDCGSRTEQGASSDQVGIDAASTTTPIPVRSSIHLAKHEGYELSRPTEFFDQYGSYVLGMLRILQHCLTVAAVAIPVAALAESGLKDVMDGVKSMSESTMQAVDMSINILETKLGGADATDNLATTESNGQEDKTMFENLAALEGADLRRLDTFLRNNDNDKILGNLYRITTEQGNVKWVCFEHYKETYRQTGLSSFVQSVETAGGTYDLHLGKVTIKLKSGTSSKDFFRRLATQTPAVQTLDVTLDWDFGSADLVTLVNMVSKSTVKAVQQDLQDDHTSNATIASLRPGKGRYHSLLGLLSNTKLRSLQLSNVYLLGTRTSNLPSSFSASWLQSFGFYGEIDEEDLSRLTNIISHCSQLVDLRLANEFRCIMGLSLQQAVLTLKKLRRLHLSGLHIDQDSNLDDPRPMKEIVYYTSLEVGRLLAKTIRQSGPVLEVLVLHSSTSRSSVDIGPEDPTPIQLLDRRESAPSEPISNAPHLSALTHLDLSVPLTRLTLNYLSTILPRLNLVHFGFGVDSHELFQHCNIASLKSLSICVSYYTNLKLLHPIDDGTAAPAWDGLEQLYFRNMSLYTKVPIQILQSVQLTRLYLEDVDPISLAAALEAINLSKLQEISFNGCYYLPSAERALAKRINEFTESLVIRLDEFSSTKYVEEGGKPRTAVGSFETLPRHRVINMDPIYNDDHHYRFLKHVLPVYFH